MLLHAMFLNLTQIEQKITEMDESKPKPVAPVENSYLQYFLELWYTELLEPEMEGHTENECVEISQATSIADKPLPTLNMGMSTVYASLKVSRELALRYPAGFSLLLKRFFWEPLKLQNDLANVSVGDFMECVAIERQSEVKRVLRSDPSFYSHFWASKSNAEILEGLLDSILVRNIKLDSKNSKDLDIATICWERMRKPSDLSIKAPLHQLCLHKVQVFAYLMSKLAPTFFKRTAQQQTQPTPGDSQKALSCFRAPSSRAQISDGRSTLLNLLPSLLSKLPNDIQLKCMNYTCSASSQLLSLVWPYFALFMKTRRNSQISSSSSSQETDSAIELDFGNRFPPGALKALIQYFYNGTASFEPFEAVALLHYAEELRFCDDKKNPSVGFQGLMDHLVLMSSLKKFCIPHDQAVYGLAFAAEARHVEIWQKSIEALYFHFMKNPPSHSVQWMHETSVDTLWLASWSLLSGTIQYPFKVDLC